MARSVEQAKTMQNPFKNARYEASTILKTTKHQEAQEGQVPQAQQKPEVRSRGLEFYKNFNKISAVGWTGAAIAFPVILPVAAGVVAFDVAQIAAINKINKKKEAEGKSSELNQTATAKAGDHKEIFNKMQSESTGNRKKVIAMKPGHEFKLAA